MKIDVPISYDLSHVGELAKNLEELGIDGIFTSETKHDPFLPLTIASQTTNRVDLITNIAVAFARSPMNIAHLAHDLNYASKGRFVLGLGSQIRPHITNRFAMPWSKPAPRMREFIQALHAIWDAWYNQQPLKFRGEHYNHTLMTPFFTPENLEYGPPRIMLAAVGPEMTTVAGAYANGLLAHPFATIEYLNQVTLPALRRGFEVESSFRDTFELCVQPLIATGRDPKEIEREKIATRKQLAFYGSTPAYKRVLDSIGRGDLHEELHTLSKRGRWDEMGDRISDELVEKFAVVGKPEDVASMLKERFSGVADRVSVYSKHFSNHDYDSILRGLTL